MKRPRILVIGDTIVDHYVEVRSFRQAQETPIPVWDVVRSWNVPGGAANVVMNVKSIVGKHADVDYHGHDISSVDMLLKRAGVDVLAYPEVGGSIRKTRYVSYGKIVSRFDEEWRYEPDEFYSKEFCDLIGGYRYDVVVLSDYAKGTIVPIHSEFARKAPISIVDSKRRDLSIFSGLGILKLNESEAGVQSPNFESSFDCCIVTRGAKGSEIRIPDRSVGGNGTYVIHRDVIPLKEFFVETGLDPTKFSPSFGEIPLHRWASKKAAVDPTGCGDTHTAALAAYLAFHPESIRRATIFANEMASQVANKFGVSVPEVPQERLDELFGAEKEDGVQAG